MRIQCTCETCGVAFEVVPARMVGRRGTFCSWRCRYAVPPLTLSDDGTSAYVPLIGRRGTVLGHAVIDAADAELVGRWRWGMNGANGYAVRRNPDEGVPRIIRMHRMLLGLTPSDDLEVDHINRDRLDNRRANLRAIPKAAQQQNIRSHVDATSSHRGVSWDRRRATWVAAVKANGKNLHLGQFDTEEEAAEVARAARARLLPYAVD